MRLSTKHVSTYVKLLGKRTGREFTYNYVHRWKYLIRTTYCSRYVSEKDRINTIDRLNTAAGTVKMFAFYFEHTRLLPSVFQRSYCDWSRNDICRFIAKLWSLHALTGLVSRSKSKRTDVRSAKNWSIFEFYEQ